MNWYPAQAKEISLTELEGEIITHFRFFEWGDYRHILGTELLGLEKLPAQVLVFYTISGKIFLLTHLQECCENVELIDIVGDLNSLLYTKIVSATMSCSEKDSDLVQQDEKLRQCSSKYGNDLELWTFYTIQGKKDSVTLRWYGNSNGYYSVGVQCFIVNDEEK